ncbi:MAG: guanylate kinase [Hyphomicrobiales bacterium]|nr:guanylate kinase [Hyphomicrobiales bacterium]MDE2016486.1 guanylate kinase [Hyphomicrobiales bacterium]
MPDTANAAPPAHNRRGMVLILSSPSGAGKTTLSRMMLADRSLGLELSVSVTTRARRSSEVDGVHYRFLDKARFEAMRRGGELLESAEVHDNFYGTPRAPAAAAMAAGRDMMFDIDYQGARQVRAALGEDVVSVFILPPSMAELRARLERRAEDSRETIDRRLEAARREIERWRDYDYVVVNRDLQACYGELLAILAAERLRKKRAAPAVEAFVAGLLAG